MKKYVQGITKLKSFMKKKKKLERNKLSIRKGWLEKIWEKQSQNCP